MDRPPRRAPGSTSKHAALYGRSGCDCKPAEHHTRIRRRRDAGRPGERATRPANGRRCPFIAGAVGCQPSAAIMSSSRSSLLVARDGLIELVPRLSTARISLVLRLVQLGIVKAWRVQEADSWIGAHGENRIAASRAKAAFHHPSTVSRPRIVLDIAGQLHRVA